MADRTFSNSRIPDEVTLGAVRDSMRRSQKPRWWQVAILIILLTFIVALVVILFSPVGENDDSRKRFLENEPSPTLIPVLTTITPVPLVTSSQERPISVTPSNAENERPDLEGDPITPPDPYGIDTTFDVLQLLFGGGAGTPGDGAGTQNITPPYSSPEADMDPRMGPDG